VWLSFWSLGHETLFAMSILYESAEQIEAVYPRAKERIAYRGLLRVRSSGVMPVSLELSFIPPHPFSCDVPQSHTIRGRSITEVYSKLVSFFRKFGFEFCRV
jgi:hypothetical protein